MGTERHLAETAQCQTGDGKGDNSASAPRDTPPLKRHPPAGRHAHLRIGVGIVPRLVGQVSSFAAAARARYNGGMRGSRSAPSALHRASFRWALCAGLILFASGCQSDAPQHPGDHMRVERVIKAVEDLRTAYENRDLNALRALRSTATDLDRLERGAEQDFSAYDAISLTLTIERMYIQGEQATVNIRWEGEWQHESDETPVTDRGYGALVWSDRRETDQQVVRLEEMTGNLPFGIANR